MSVEDRVKQVVQEMLGLPEIGQITGEKRFEEDFDADSLDIVELIMAFEDEFEIEIPDSDVEKITTVQQAIDYISAAVSK